MSNPTPKLTKKQKKGLEFRQRKGKQKEIAQGVDLPVIEDQDAIALDDAQLGEPDETIAQARNPSQNQPTPVAESKKKRKREAVEDENAPTLVKKTRKQEDNFESLVPTPEGKETKKNASKDRFILFVGAFLI